MRTNIPTYFWYFPVIPLGLLHDAHYSQNVPKYLNVGSLGLTLAHEILHSLDQMGRGFDANGTRRVSKPPFIFHSFGARKHDRWSSIYDIFSWIETLLKLLQNLFSILFFSRKMHHFFPRKQDLSCGNNRCFFLSKIVLPQSVFVWFCASSPIKCRRDKTVMSTFACFLAGLVWWSNSTKLQ